MNERGKIPAVVYVRVRKNYTVDTIDRKREMAVSFEGIAPASLIKATVKKKSLACGLNVVHRPGDGLGRTPKCDSH